MFTGCSCDGTVSSQGDLHVWPWVVRISTLSGSDSNFSAWSCSDEEFDDNAEEQPVSETPTTAATTTESPRRDMTSLLPLLCVTQPSRGAPFSQSEIGSCTLRFVKGPKDWLKAPGSEARGRRGLGALGNGS